MLKLVNDIPDTNHDIAIDTNYDIAIDTNYDIAIDIKDDSACDEASIKRTAKQMLLPAYADKSIIDAIHQYLSQFKTEVATDDLIQDMFDVQTEDEFRRIRSTVWNDLKRGQGNGRWQKVGKSSWAIPQEEMPILEAINKATAVEDEDEDAHTEERVLMLVQ
jgi:hypothetical protein